MHLTSTMSSIEDDLSRRIVSSALKRNRINPTDITKLAEVSA